eukprot:1191218-Prorocentrum_minimum.AAC.1
MIESVRTRPTSLPEELVLIRQFKPPTLPGGMSSYYYIITLTEGVSGSARWHRRRGADGAAEQGPPEGHVEQDVSAAHAGPGILRALRHPAGPGKGPHI